ncbi:MAG: iron ABC transporter permease [Acholeplasmataceae bacterium]|nr:iron ABC transporter permease [Acholeplasmataceae bacterium]
MALFVVAVAMLVLYPIAHLIIESFQVNDTFNPVGYIEVFQSHRTYKALWNTIRLQSLVLLMTWIIGGALAIIRVKTDIRYKKVIDVFVFLSLVIPPFIYATSMTLFVGRMGILTKLLHLIGLENPFDIHTFIGAAFCLSMHLYPFVYYGVRNRIKLIDSDMINSARTLGAKRFRLLFSIVIPTLVPAFMATGLMILARTMANYAVPATLLLPEGIEVLATRVYAAQSDLALNWTSVLCLFLVGLSYGLFIGTSFFSHKRNHHDQSGRSENENGKIRLNTFARYGITTSLFIFFVVFTIIPVLTVLYASFFKSWGLTFFNGFGEPLSWNHVTFGNYRLLFSQGLIIQPLKNSFVYGGIAALTASLIAAISVYMNHYRKGFLNSILIHVSQLPIGIPNIVLAIAAMLAWRTPPFDYYNTPTIIIITYIVLFTPIVIKQVQSVVANLDDTAVKSARTMGASSLKIFSTIYFQQIRHGLFTGFLMVFMIAFKEIPISLLLYYGNTGNPDSTITLGVMLFRIQSNSYGLEMTAAVAVIVIIISLLLNIVLIHINQRMIRYGQSIH